MGSQEVSKPVMIAVILIAVILVGLIGWRFLRPQKYPGYQAPPGGAGVSGPAGPGMSGQAPPPMIPGQEPGRVYPQAGTPR